MELGIDDGCQFQSSSSHRISLLLFGAVVTCLIFSSIVPRFALWLRKSLFVFLSSASCISNFFLPCFLPRHSYSLPRYEFKSRTWPLRRSTGALAFHTCLVTHPPVSRLVSELVIEQHTLRALITQGELESDLPRLRIFVCNNQIDCPFFYRNSSGSWWLLYPMRWKWRTKFPLPLNVNSGTNITDDWKGVMHREMLEPSPADTSCANYTHLGQSVRVQRIQPKLSVMCVAMRRCGRDNVHQQLRGSHPSSFGHCPGIHACISNSQLVALRGGWCRLASMYRSM